MAQPNSESYDVVIVGAGVGGISAGAVLAKEGRSVCVLEQADAAGGYAHAFKRGDYTWDPAVHVFPQGHDGALPDAVLRYLGVRDRVRMIPFPHCYTAIYPDVRITTPFDFEGFIEVHQEHFPAEAEAIDRFFRLCRTVHHQAHSLPPTIGLGGLAGVAEDFPELLQYLRVTLDDVLDEHFSDPRLKGVAGALWPYPGAPPSRLSFVTFATTLSVYVDGAFYCEGSTQSLVDAFVAAIEMHGGEIVYNTLVKKIVVEDGSAVGVVLEDGSELRGEAIISNADAKSTFEEMIGTDHLPSGFARRVARMTPSLSAVLVFCGVPRSLVPEDSAHEVFHYRDYDQERIHEDIREGRPGGTWASVPSSLDPSLAPEGEHSVILTSMAQYDIGRPWEEEAERFADELVGNFEAAFPGLREAITFREVATPLTMERFCLNHKGAAYGWENVPSQTGGKRSPHVTPIKDLYLSGHWTQPGSGSVRCLVSGVHTAQMVLSAAGVPGIRLEHPDLPPSE